MTHRRIRLFDGSWGYCKFCGNKAYHTNEKSETYALCADACGYIRHFGDIRYNDKNIIQIEVSPDE